MYNTSTLLYIIFKCIFGTVVNRNSTSIKNKDLISRGSVPAQCSDVKRVRVPLLTRRFSGLGLVLRRRTTRALLSVRPGHSFPPRAAGPWGLKILQSISFNRDSPLSEAAQEVQEHTFRRDRYKLGINFWPMNPNRRNGCVQGHWY